VCHARTTCYPDKAEQVIESVLKNPEKICPQVQGVGDLNVRRSKEVSVSDGTSFQIYLPDWRTAPISLIKRSFMKASRSDVKYISAASLFNRGRRKVS
jgi:hypothetical protein